MRRVKRIPILIILFVVFAFMISVSANEQDNVTRSHIDSPTLNQKVGNKLIVKGWVMSKEENTSIKAFIDDEEIMIDRVARPDVIEAIKDYGTINENPLPGYYKELNINNLGYGNHKLDIKIYKDEQEILSDGVVFLLGTETRNFNKVKPKTKVMIDSPVLNKSYSTKVLVQGWTMSEEANTHVKAYIDSNEVNVTRYARPDVIKAIKDYGTINENPLPGYTGIIDITNYNYGNHTVKIEDFNRVKPKTKIYIQKPINNETLSIDTDLIAWVMSEEANTYAKMYIDNNEVNVTRYARPDVIEAIKDYGTINENPLPGIKANYNFDGIKDGKHKITTKVFSGFNHNEISSASNEFNLKKYESKMNLESPSISVLNSRENLFIRGWAITQAKENSVRVFIDNTEVNVQRRVRGDVLNAFPEYNNTVNSTPGFELSVGINGFSDGKHNISIRLYNELGEITNKIEYPVQFFKNIYQGIDVSEHNGNINWTQVKNSGINFAIIRIGYRGYGTAKLVKDAKFEDNYNGARNAGLKVGIYFFSQAINYNEGVEEAKKTVEWLNKRPLQYPIAFDTENSTGFPNGRADKISINARTDAARGFCNQILASNYKTNIYASRDWFYHKLNMVALANYDEWLAHYTENQNNRSNYTGRYQMWQYTSSGSISGISGRVDKNVSYYNYS